MSSLNEYDMRFATHSPPNPHTAVVTSVAAAAIPIPPNTSSHSNPIAIGTPTNSTNAFADRRFSTDLPAQSPSQMQNVWTNGWTASSLLSEDVHGKLFGDALVSFRSPFLPTLL